eukprot:440032_1
MAFNYQDKNFFICPSSITSKQDCKKLIDSISKYSKRCYEFENISENDVPYPIMFILNLLSSKTTVMHKLTIAPKIEINKFIFDYTEQYFLANYKPRQIPYLYAILMQKKGLFLNNISARNDSRKQMLETVKIWQTAFEYVQIYENQLKNNKLNVLSQIVDKRLEKDKSFAVLHGQILFNLSISYSQINNTKMVMEMTNKSCRYFIINHNKYSSYDDYGHIAFDFATRIIKKLMSWDCGTGKHQKRYKHLLKISLNSLKKTYGNQGHIYAEKYGMLMATLGYYYALFEKRFDKAQTLLYMSINIIQKYDKYVVALRDVYDFLLWIEMSCCNVNQCENILAMSMDFNKRINLLPQLNYDKQDLKTVREMRYWSKVKKRRHFVSYWNNVVANLVKSAIAKVSKQCLFEYINYVRNIMYYRTMKNLCSFKECNYKKCRGKDKKLELCSKCKSVYYCCRKHQ